MVAHLWQAIIQTRARHGLKESYLLLRSCHTASLGAVRVHTFTQTHTHTVFLVFPAAPVRPGCSCRTFVPYLLHIHPCRESWGHRDESSRICALGVVYVVQCTGCFFVCLCICIRFAVTYAMNVCAEGKHPLVHSFLANMREHSLLLHNTSALENMVQQIWSNKCY